MGRGIGFLACMMGMTCVWVVAPCCRVVKSSFLVIFLVEAHDHNAVYTHKDVCAEKHGAVDLRFKSLQFQVNDNRADIDSIKRQISAALIFSVSTLIGVVLILLKVG